MSLNRYIISKILQMIPVLFLVLLLTFFLIHLSPGDPAWILAGDNASPEYVEFIRQHYGFDKPIIEQFWIYFKKIISGDLGFSFTYHRPVFELIIERIPATIILLSIGQIFAIILGTLLGAFSAKKSPSKVDSFISATALGLYCMPIFWTGLILILIFSVWTKGFLPSSGMYSLPKETGLFFFFDVLRHMILPTAAIFLYNMPTFYRLTRATIFEVMREDFVTTARAIGLSENTVFFKHCLRNALLPSVTMAGLNMGHLFSGALITETVFSWPGVGRLMYDSIFAKDFPLSIGILLISAMTVIIAMVITDIVYAYLDPRIRYDF